MGKKHVKEGVITITQKKGQDTVEVAIPILPELKTVLDEVQKRRIAPTFLLSQYGKERTPGGLSTLFRKWCNGAGLPDDCHAHGLRKTFAKIAAEAGLTPHEIAALTGHRTLAEVTRYTAEADRKKLAAAGMKKIEKGTRNGNPT